ncbi:hypothetical protein [Amycolatopsis sp. lyj-23]|uniref:hypothetical protein n=1 Tax=Amycolatopsis sp. lyj-23 TaxID=2789283 RepID=UPI003978F13C
MSGNEDRGETHDVSTPLAETPQAPPPPPTRRSPGRVQFNHRIRADRDRLLQKYKNKHETSMQAIVDQMVDEYLSARGLLPQDSE